MSVAQTVVSPSDSHVDPAARTRAVRQVVAGAGAAFGLWFLLFSPWTTLTSTIHDRYFWYGMSAATMSMAAATLIIQRRDFRRLFAFRPKFLLVGLVHAILLYALSRFGVLLLSEFFAGVVPQIQAVYATRTQLDPLLIAALLAFVIAPCEEIFWRGLMLDRLLSIVSHRTALTIAIALYSLVHMWAMNPMLLLAALVLGAHWSYLYWKFGSLVPGVVSHLVWDVAIFVLFPISF